MHLLQYPWPCLRCADRLRLPAIRRVTRMAAHFALSTARVPHRVAAGLQQRDGIGRIAALHHAAGPASIGDGMRGQSTASCTFMPKSITLSITSSTVLMMVGPPGEPSTRYGLPSRSDDGRSHRRERPSCAAAMALASPCTRPIRVGLAGLGGEIVHLVVQQEAQPGHRHAVAVAAVQRVGHRHRVALAHPRWSSAWSAAFVAGQLAACTWLLGVACSGSIDLRNCEM